jgi:plasmid stabilization system protein ParE
MNPPIAIGFEATDEVDTAYRWYENQRVGLGEEFLAILLGQLERIQENPEAWAVVYRNIRACPLRRFPYVVYFRIRSDQIEVVAVQHAHRNPRAWRRRA